MATTLLLAPPARAHHSAAMFDASQTITVDGTVKDFSWGNPHAFIDMVVEGAPSQTGSWSLEGSSINILARKGWSKTSVKPGDKISASIHPMRDGGRGGYILTLRLADGRTLVDHDY